MRDISTKINNGGATADGRLEASEYNEVQLDLENGVTRSGQTLSALDMLQNARAMFLNGVGAQSFIDSGTANAIVLTPVTGASGYVVGQDYTQLNGARAIFSVAAGNSGAVTLNIGQTAGTLLGVKALVDINGIALTSGFYQTGDLIEARFSTSLDEWVIVANYTKLSTDIVGIQGAYKNLKIEALGINNYNCVITADEVVLKTSTGKYMTVATVNKTVNANGVVGDPLSIMSVRAASTWYYPWLWYNDISGLTATLDISSTAPTAPTGYSSSDYKAYLPNAACRTDSSVNKYLLQTKTRDNQTNYILLAGSNTAVMPTMASGVAGSLITPTWTAVGISGFAPPNATSILLALSGGGDSGSGGMAAPSNVYGAPTGYLTTQVNPPPMVTSNSATSGGSIGIIMGEFLLESTNVYYAGGNGGSGLFCMGWR